MQASVELLLSRTHANQAQVPGQAPALANQPLAPVIDLMPPTGVPQVAANATNAANVLGSNAATLQSVQAEPEERMINTSMHSP